MDAANTILNPTDWQIALSHLPQEVGQRKGALLALIDQIIRMIPQPMQAGNMVWDLLRVAKPLPPVDYSEVVEKIVKISSLYSPEGVQTYHNTGWIVQNAHLEIRLDELYRPDFWEQFQALKKQNPLQDVTVHGYEGDFSFHQQIVTELAEAHPSPTCLAKKVYCAFKDQMIQVPEALFRALIPALAPALETGFQPHGTRQAPLEVQNLTSEEWSVIQRYLESPIRFEDFTGQEIAVLLELLEFTGQTALRDELHTKLDKFLDDSVEYDKRLPWMAEIYANTNIERAPLRSMLERHLSLSINLLVDKERRDLANPQSTVTAESLFAERIEIVQQAKLAHLTVVGCYAPRRVEQNDRLGPLPQWYQKGMATLTDLQTITFVDLQAFTDCQKILPTLPQLTTLIFMDKKAYDACVKAFPQLTVQLAPDPFAGSWLEEIEEVDD